ncbi:MAG: hypothetical protein AAFX06_27115, partial [Planctomycetota bacterium]
ASAAVNTPTVTVNDEDHASSTFSTPELPAGGAIEDIGFPKGLSMSPTPPVAPSNQASPLFAMGGDWSEVVPMAQEAATDACLAAPDALIGLGDVMIEFGQSNAGGGGLIDIGLKASLGVHRSLDLITGDVVDETGLRDLVLAALTEEWNAVDPAFPAELIRLPHIGYANAAVLAAGLATVNRRRRRTDGRLSHVHPSN